MTPIDLALAKRHDTAGGVRAYLPPTALGRALDGHLCRAGSATSSGAASPLSGRGDLQCPEPDQRGLLRDLE